MRRLVPFLVVTLMVVGACTDQRTFDPPTTSTIGSTTTTVAPETTTTSVAATTTTTTATTSTTEPSYDVIISGGTSEEPDLSIEGPERVTFPLGDDVELAVLSSVDGELHLHGYDLFYELIADEPMTVTFTADIPGIFELEIEGSHTLVVEFEIVP